MITTPAPHIVETSFEGERAYWECSCGKAGSCGADRVDLHSDAHIRAVGERRLDTYKG